VCPTQSPRDKIEISDMMARLRLVCTTMIRIILLRSRARDAIDALFLIDVCVCGTRPVCGRLAGQPSSQLSLGAWFGHRDIPYTPYRRIISAPIDKKCQEQSTEDSFWDIYIFYRLLRCLSKRSWSKHAYPLQQRSRSLWRACLQAGRPRPGERLQRRRVASPLDLFFFSFFLTTEILSSVADRRPSHPPNYRSYHSYHS
jgi:hypothetical protein